MWFQKKPFLIKILNKIMPTLNKNRKKTDFNKAKGKLKLSSVNKIKIIKCSMNNYVIINSKNFRLNKISYLRGELYGPRRINIAFKISRLKFIVKVKFPLKSKDTDQKLAWFHRINHLIGNWWKMIIHIYFQRTTKEYLQQIILGTNRWIKMIKNHGVT